MTQHYPQGLDSHLKSWLYASGSLTQQLTQLAGGQFRVEPLQESFQRMQRQDSLWLNMPHQHTAWVREVFYTAVNPSRGYVPKVFFRF